MHRPYRHADSNHSADGRAIHPLGEAGQDHKGKFGIMEYAAGMRKKIYLDSEMRTNMYNSTVRLIRVIQADWSQSEERLRWAVALSVFVLLQWSILTVQIVGVTSGLTGDTDWLMRADGSIRRGPYYTLTCMQTVCVAMQLVSISRWYRCRVTNLQSFDSIWRGVRLMDHPEQRLYWLIEMLILALHEPPGFFEFWSDSYKLQMLALIRVYVFLQVLRSRSDLVTLKSRLLCALFRVGNNKAFQMRVWMHTQPQRLLVLSALVGWAVLSVCFFLAEDGALNYEESMYLTFITMTTVGYGDISPSTRVGRFVACLSTMHGLLTTSFLINAVAQALELSPAQSKVVQFITELRMSRNKENQAARIMQLVIQAYAHKRRHNLDAFSKEHAIALAKACDDFRKSRRALKRFVSSVHSEVEPSDLAEQLANIERKVDMLAGHALPGSTIRYSSAFDNHGPSFDRVSSPATAQVGGAGGNAGVSSGDTLILARMEELSKQVTALQVQVAQLAAAQHQQPRGANGHAGPTEPILEAPQ